MINSISKRRVVVTGIGVISSVGSGPTDFFDSLFHAKSGVSEIEFFDTEGYRTDRAAYIKQIPSGENTNKDRIYNLLDIILNQVIVDSEIKIELLDKTRVGVCIGSCLGNVECVDRYYSGICKDNAVSAIELIDQPHCMPARYIADKLGLEGICTCVDSACSAGTNSIGLGFEWIKYGKADMMFTGGVDPFSRLSLSGFGSLQTLTTTSCKPFSDDRDGVVLGEAGVILLLEEMKHALNRGAKIYCEVTGIGSSNDAFHETKPDPEAGGALRAMQSCLAEAGARPEQISYVNAHGTGTKLNDLMEMHAIDKLLSGTAGLKPPISSIKPLVGHCLGASGSVEFAALALSVYNGKIPPTANFTRPMSEFSDYDFIPNSGRTIETLDLAISNSFAFGGSTASISVRKFN